MQVQKAKKGYKLVKSLFGKYEEIPEDWEIKPTSEILKITMGQSPPSESYNQEGKGLPFYQGVTDFGTIYPNPTVWCTDPRKIAEDNSILFSVRAPVGEINLTREKCCLGRGVAALNPLENDLLYCYYLVNQNKKRFSVYSQGTTYDAINRDEIANTKLPYTNNINEQQKIASILSNVDSLIQQTQKEIEQTQRLKKGLMQRLLTRGIGHTRFKKIKLMFGKEMEIPEEWNVLHFNEFISFKSGSTPSRTNPEYFKGVIPWVTSTDLNREIISYTTEKITWEAVQNTRLKILPKGTFLIALYGLEAAGTRGKCGILGIDATINQACMALIPSENVDSKYLYYYYLNFGEKIVFSVAQGTKQQNLSEDVLSFIKMPIPTKGEQKDIIRILENVDSKYSVLVQSKSQLETLKKGLMQKLLTGQIRVRV
jgi:type I restriction enzyme S subunit